MIDIDEIYSAIRIVCVARRNSWKVQQPIVSYFQRNMWNLFFSFDSINYQKGM